MLKILIKVKKKKYVSLSYVFNMSKHTNRITSSSINIFHPHYLVYKYLLADLKVAIRKYAKGKLLDIGCGNKPYITFTKNYVNEHLGCDIEQSSLNLVDFICPATQIPLENDSIDTVLCTQVLEHVYEHKKVFLEVHRILKTGCYFIASVPMYWQHHEEPYDFFRFTKYGIENLLKETGFEVVEIKSNGGKWALLGQSINLAFGKGRNNSFLSTFKRVLFKLILGRFFVNILFLVLDKISKDDIDTTNFVFIGKKL